MNEPNNDADVFGALRIHAICLDLRLPSSDARLFTYIFAKASNSEVGCDYFRQPQEADVAALQLLLADAGGEAIISELAPKYSSVAGQLQQVLIGRELARIDQKAKSDFGLEFPLRYELENRLRLHKDAAFREIKLRTFESWIEPQVTEYDTERVKSAFRKERKRNKQLKQQLDRLAKPK